MVGGGMILGNGTLLMVAVLQLIPVHENILTARRYRMLAQVHDKRKLDAIDFAEMARQRQDEKVARGSFMSIPMNIEGIGIDDIGFTDVVTINLHNDFQVSRHAMKHVELYSAPTQVEGVLKVVDPLKITTQLAKHWFCIMFRYLHIVVRNETDVGIMHQIASGFRFLV